MAISKRGSRRLRVDCPSCRTRLDGLCKDCAPEVLRIVTKYKWADHEVKAGHDLFRPSEPRNAVYHLIKGWAFLYELLEDGRRQILHFALPGTFLGPYSDRATVFGAEALTDAAISVVPYEKLGSLFEKHPEVGLRFACIASRERDLAYDHLSSVGRRSARERIACLLLELFVRYRMQWPGFRIENMYLPLTQEHIGDATGLTGVHVNRILRGLREDGIVEFHYRQLRILNPDKLVEVATINPLTMSAWAGRDLNK
jgi:CRP-like cAMP-binding protein